MAANSTVYPFNHSVPTEPSPCPGTVVGTGTYQFEKQSPAEIVALRSSHSSKAVA